MLKNWKIWQKLTAIAVAIGLMIPVLLYLAVSARNQDITFARKESLGGRYLLPLTQLFAKVPEHSGRLNTMLSGDSGQRPSVAALRAAIDKDFEALAAIDREAGEALGSTRTFNAIRQEWQALKTGAGRMSADQSFAAHTRLIDRLATLIQDVGDSSNIRLDPIRDSYYLGEIVLLWGPRAIEDRGQLRGLAGGMVARGRVTADEAAELNLLISQLSSSNAPTERAVRLIAEDNPDFAEKANGLLKAADEKTRIFTQVVQNRILRVPVPTVSPADLFAAGNAAVDAQSALSNAMVDRLQVELNTRVARLSRARNLLVLGSLVSVLLALFLVVYITGLISRQVAAISGMFQRIGVGDFGSRANALSNDELGAAAVSINAVLDNTISLMQSRDERDRIQGSIMKLLDEISGLAEGDLSREAEVTADLTGAIADGFNTVTGQLREIIGNVQATTLQVSSAASEIQTSTELLADGSEAQSSQIVGTSAAVDAIALSIQQVSENAVSAAGVADLALSSAKEGAEAVARTVDGMNGIRVQVQESAKRIKRLGESSQEIGEIV
ncbi:MAG TPA: methyl-accepting chemotaxis protein, partial [Thermoanaerobaculia bacterium]|nr:methyl-accepting chemotaxis protein [Thermoanaerobaculia bacterium]